MRALALLTLALLVTAPSASALTLLGVGVLSPGEVIVGYEEGALDDVLRLVLGPGATLLRQDDKLRILVLKVPDVTTFLAGATALAGVEFAEKNDDTKVHGAQWNGAQWNGAQWNGAQWNGAQWNGAQWNVNGIVTDDPGTGFQWGLAATGAPLAWRLSQGEGNAKLCVLDSGLAAEHDDIAPNAGASFNAIDPSKSAHDDGGHGTHVAGIAAAAIGNGYGIAGVGNVEILPVKVLKADGTGKEDDLAVGLVWCAEQGAGVALMALGVTEEGPTLKRALAYAAARDVLLVASAGNGGCDGCVGYPARHPDVVAVGAVTTTLARASFSARGTQVDLAAPGVDIIGPFPGDRFVYGSGTSQAAAFVAGAAALLRDTHPELDAQETRGMLEDTARPLGASASFGHGLVDVGAALREA